MQLQLYVFVYIVAHIQMAKVGSMQEFHNSFIYNNWSNEQLCEPYMATNGMLLFPVPEPVLERA